MLANLCNTKPALLSLAVSSLLLAGSSQAKSPKTKTPEPIAGKWYAACLGGPDQSSSEIELSIQPKRWVFTTHHYEGSSSCSASSRYASYAATFDRAEEFAKKGHLHEALFKSSAVLLTLWQKPAILQHNQDKIFNKTDWRVGVPVDITGKEAVAGEGPDNFPGSQITYSYRFLKAELCIAEIRPQILAASREMPPPPDEECFTRKKTAPNSH